MYEQTEARAKSGTGSHMGEIRVAKGKQVKEKAKKYILNEMKRQSLRKSGDKNN